MISGLVAQICRWSPHQPFDSLAQGCVKFWLRQNRSRGEGRGLHVLTMVYLSDIQDFETAAQELFKQQPLRTRYLVKYRHKEGKVVLKVTNDRICLKFKTELIAYLKHVESFTQKFVGWTATKDLSKVEELDAELEDAKKAAKPKPTAKSKRRKG